MQGLVWYVWFGLDNLTPRRTLPDLAGPLKLSIFVKATYSFWLVDAQTGLRFFFKSYFHHFRLNYFLPDLAGPCRTLDNVTPRRTLVVNTTPDLPKFLGLCVDINGLIFLSIYIPLTPPLTVLNTLIVKKTTALAISLFTESLTNPLFSPSFFLCGSGY